MYNQKCRSTIKQYTNTGANPDLWQNPGHLQHPNDCGEKCKKNQMAKIYISNITMIINTNDSQTN